MGLDRRVARAASVATQKNRLPPVEPKQSCGSGAARSPTWERFWPVGSLWHLIKERTHTDAERIRDPVEQVHGDVDVLPLQLAQMTSIDAAGFGQAALRQATFGP